MRRALLVLTATEAAVFSERGATEGEHRTLAHPTGAALLGWAARSYETFNEADRFTVFHSGAVRFSNAMPITDDGKVAFPAPRLLTEHKHARGGIFADNLVLGALRVGRKPRDDDQWESINRDLFVTGDGEVVDPDLAGRLRTATLGGAAAEGQLFGYQLISPTKSPRYAATLEADDLSDEAWSYLIDTFKRPIVSLGRASNTAHGGGYVCEVNEGGLDIWPHGAIAAGTSRVRVWVLSDLALVNDHGGPCFQPAPEEVGLPPGGRLDGVDSAIGLRRYAPWNGKLRCRDLERQVIAAGSVLTYVYDTPLPGIVLNPGPFGLWRETGLGRVWVAPPLLAGDPGDAPASGQALALAPRLSPAEPHRDAEDVTVNHGELLQWLEQRRKMLVQQ
jgi:hypothetical protein